MSGKKVYKLIVLCMVLVLLFSGCKKNEAVPPASSGIITMQMRLPTSFNPLAVENKSVRDVLSLCYEPLFRVDSDMMPKGVLAESIKLSDDGMSAILDLKSSVLWHDGTQFTSADVIHTINTLKEMPESPYYGCVKYIDNVQATSPLSLSVIFTRTYGQIVHSLYFPIIQASNTAIDEKIVGTGPYALESYTEGASLSLKKYDKWHGGDVLCESVSVSIVRDNDAATSAFNSGSVNTITGNSYDSKNSAPKGNVARTQYPSLQYEFMVFNHEKDIFSSSTVRAAISSAIDRAQIASEAYSGEAYEANSPIHPVAEKKMGDSGGSRYDLSSAQETLFLEGYSVNEATGVLEDSEGEKLSFTLLVNSENTERAETAQLLCSQLFLAGIEVKIREVDFETYCEEIADGDYDAYLGGVTLQNMYDFEFLLSKDTEINNYGYESEYMDAALLGIANAPSYESLNTALVTFEEVFLREQPFCGIVFKNDVLLTAENIKGDFAPCQDFPYANIGLWNVQ